MKYHSIRVSWEPRIKGVKDGMNMVEIVPATQQKLSHWRDRNFVWPDTDFSFRKMAPEDKSELTAEMRPKANLTDFMDFAPHMLQVDMIVSQKAADFLTEKKMLYAEFVPITLFRNGQKLQDQYYFWVNHMLRPEHFEYEGTVLRSGTPLLGFQFHEVNDVTEFRKVDNDFRYVTYVKTRLKPPKTPPDCLAILGCGIYATEQFWKDYEASGLVGLEMGKDTLELMTD